MFQRSELFVSFGVVDGDDYRFPSWRGQDVFSVIADKPLLDEYDRWFDARQPVEGRSKRLAALVAAPVLKALQNGEKPVASTFRLTAAHLDEAFASRH